MPRILATSALASTLVVLFTLGTASAGGKTRHRQATSSSKPQRVQRQRVRMVPYGVTKTQVITGKLAKTGANKRGPRDVLVGKDGQPMGRPYFAIKQLKSSGLLFGKVQYANRYAKNYEPGVKRTKGEPRFTWVQIDPRTGLKLENWFFRNVGETRTGHAVGKRMDTFYNVMRPDGKGAVDPAYVKVYSRRKNLIAEDFIGNRLVLDGRTGAPFIGSR